MRPVNKTTRSSVPFLFAFCDMQFPLSTGFPIGDSADGYLAATQPGGLLEFGLTSGIHAAGQPLPPPCRTLGYFCRSLQFKAECSNELPAPNSPKLGADNIQFTYSKQQKSLNLIRLRVNRRLWRRDLKRLCRSHGFLSLAFLEPCAQVGPGRPAGTGCLRLGLEYGTGPGGPPGSTCTPPILTLPEATRSAGDSSQISVAKLAKACRS